jgi:hypothetical protein
VINQQPMLNPHPLPHGVPTRFVVEMKSPRRLFRGLFIFSDELIRHSKTPPATAGGTDLFMTADAVMRPGLVPALHSAVLGVWALILR